MARSFLAEKGLPKAFWFWACREAFQRMNMIPVEIGRTEPTDADKGGEAILSTPFELFYDRKPDLRTLFDFGCVGFVRRTRDGAHHRGTFESQTYPGIAVGRSDVTNCIVFWSPETCKFFTSADYHLEGLRNMLEDLDPSYTEEATPLLYGDNQGAIYWSKSEAITKKLRHLNIREVAIRDAVRLGLVDLNHIASPLNHSDLFTKEMKDSEHFLDLRGATMSRRDCYDT